MSEFSRFLEVLWKRSLSAVVKPLCLLFLDSFNSFLELSAGVSQRVEIKVAALVEAPLIWLTYKYIIDRFAY